MSIGVGSVVDIENPLTLWILSFDTLLGEKQLWNFHPPGGVINVARRRFDDQACWLYLSYFDQT